jgi:hypothetical protein
MRLSNLRPHLRLLLLSITLSTSVCLAQFESGTVLGTIHDPSNAAIANATDVRRFPSIIAS